MTRPRGREPGDSTARLVPARFSHVSSEPRGEGWGRFTRLGAHGGELMTGFELRRGDRLVLHFELFGERFDELRAEVLRAPADQDGYRAAELRFASLAARLRLGRILRDVLSRAAR